MKIKYYLRGDKLTRQGFAPILISISWQGNRVRVASGEVCRPGNWDGEAQKVKSVKGSFYNTINPKLNSIAEAAENALHEADQRHELLTQETLLEALQPIVNSSKAAAATPVATAPVLPPAGLFEEGRGLFAEWMAEQTTKVNRTSG